MTCVSRPRRSMLYVPASNTRGLQKAKTLPADGLIIDLEEAVSPNDKVQARSAAIAATNSLAYKPREILIRANSLSTPWGKDDLIAVASSCADGVLLAKIDSAKDVRAAEMILRSAGARESLRLWVMLETPAAIIHANAIMSCDSVAGLCVGTADLAKDLCCAHPPDRAPMLHALQAAVLAARAHGKVPLDGVHLDLEDDSLLESVCKQGKALGFDGKTLIHPRQIDIANRVFAPSAEDVRAATRLIAVHDAARAEGRAITVLDGKIVEPLHVIRAQRVIEQAGAIAKLDGKLRVTTPRLVRRDWDIDEK